MTIQELIDSLNKIEDKNKNIFRISYNGDYLEVIDSIWITGDEDKRVVID